VKTFLLGHIKHPYREKLRDAIKKRVDSYSKSIVKTSSGLMHLAREMYRDVAHMETVEIPDEFFHKTFIRHLMLGTGEARKENVLVHALHENYPEYRFDGTRYRVDSCIYAYGPKKYLTNLKNHLTMYPERFMICAVFALYPGISRKGFWAIINGITNDRKYEDEIEFVDKKTSRRSTNGASVIRATIQEHRAVLGLLSPTGKLPNMKKDEERFYQLILRCFMFLNRKHGRKADMEPGVEKTNSRREGRLRFWRIAPTLIRCPGSIQVLRLSTPASFTASLRRSVRGSVSAGRNSPVKTGRRTGRTSSISRASKRAKNGIHGDDRLQWEIHMCTLSALEGRSSYLIYIVALAEARTQEDGPWHV
jgi:hypothetical protein